MCASCAPGPFGHNIKYHACITNTHCGMDYVISSVLGVRILCYYAQHMTGKSKGTTKLQICVSILFIIINIFTDGGVICCFIRFNLCFHTCSNTQMFQSNFLNS